MEGTEPRCSGGALPGSSGPLWAISHGRARGQLENPFGQEKHCKTLLGCGGGTGLALNWGIELNWDVGCESLACCGGARRTKSPLALP